MARILVPLAQGCEELEAVTVIDLLRRAGQDVDSAGLEEGTVTASRGTRLLPDITLDEALERDYDMVVLPGGQPGADNLAEDPRIRTLLDRVIDQGGHAAAICAAPLVLARAGLLRGRRVTAFPGVLENESVAGIEYTGEDVVVDGPIVTSRGPGTAMDFALALIERLAGSGLRKQVEDGLQRPPAHCSAHEAAAYKGERADYQG
ncbi:MAG: DJ-1/PfpI family protein [Gammaproteobacteria bacterium]|jgi:4-methyl-5(b-hydroxyethyl)-thiazole monophosphate biosynthesis|nr:DJ-1/PfpI family protein [Gammaproteobacteria bacterium]